MFGVDTADAPEAQPFDPAFGGAPFTVAGRRTPVAGPGTYLFTDMAAATGTACAAFMVVALESNSRAGVFTPEEWAEPQQFYAALERVGVPRVEIPNGAH